MRILLVAFISLIAWNVSLTASEPAHINEERRTLALAPSFDVAPDGTATYVWSSYLKGLEWVWTRTLDGSTKQLSPAAGVYSQTQYISAGTNTGWAFWTRRRDGLFEVVGRQWTGELWKPLVIISPPGHGALSPSAAATGSTVTLAWVDHTAEEQIAVRRFDGAKWSPVRIISEGAGPCYRPSVASSANGGVYVFWDAYQEAEISYAVYGRQVAGMVGPVERISPVGANALKPSGAWTPSSGFAVTWVTSNEVIGGAGVLDHMDAAQVAIRESGSWNRTRAGEFGEDIAPLWHGTIPRLEPAYETPWGYAGQRRRPTLAEVDGALWLFWERRILPGDKSFAPGELCGRRYEDGQWANPVMLHRGMVGYRLPGSRRATGGKIVIAARDTSHGLRTLTLNLAEGRPFQFKEWAGWKPVKLPLRKAGERPSIDIGGTRHYLYWADLHVHSALTSDAEGEPDELIHFARDRAAIDAVVIQENDSNSWSTRAFRDHRLTTFDYELGVYLSRRQTEPGRFVAFPGFEWSQRTTDDGKPNHRTVLYAGIDTPIVRHTENDNNFGELCDVVEAAGGTMFTQHEAFRLAGCPVDHNIELATGWGNYMVPPDKIHHDLAAGHKVGFVATSDGHRRNPGTGGGLTGIWAPELTPEALIESLRQRKVYATTGSRVVMDARANGAFMGEDIPPSGDVTLTASVEAPAPITRMVLIRDGEELLCEYGKGRKNIKKSFEDKPGSGFHYYYWLVELDIEAPHYPGNTEVAEGRYAWSSPHRIQVP